MHLQLHVNVYDLDKMLNSFTYNLALVIPLKGTFDSLKLKIEVLGKYLIDVCVCVLYYTHMHMYKTVALIPDDFVEKYLPSYGIPIG